MDLCLPSNFPTDRAYELIQRIHDFEKLQSESAGKSGVSESEEEGGLVKRMKIEQSSSPWDQDNISNELEAGEVNEGEYAELTQDDVVNEFHTADEEKLMDANGEIVDELMNNGDSVIVESMVGADGSVFVNEPEFKYCGNSLSESVHNEHSAEVLDIETISTKSDMRQIQNNHNSNSQSNINRNNYDDDTEPGKIWIMKEKKSETDNCYHDNSESNVQSVKHNSDNDENDINDMISDDSSYNQKIILEQLAVLRAERNKLVQETEVYKLKREKLKLQIDCYHNELKKQEMEREKLRLEIKMLQSKVMDESNDVSHYIFVP